MTASRGVLIALEGCDRAGKSSQVERLIQALKSNGHSVEMIKFPQRDTPTGHLIHDYLQGTASLSPQAIHLLFAANRWEVMHVLLNSFSRESLKEKLKNGTTLILDRYAFSGVAYSVAKGLDLHWCKQPDVGLLSPDLTLFLDLSPEAASTRPAYGEEVYENVAFQARVRAVFLSLAKESHFTLLDASKDMHTLHQEIYEAVLKKMDSAKTLPLPPGLFL